MNEMIEACARATDDDLTRELRFAVERGQRNLAEVLIKLGEYGWRRLYREEGYCSLFEYCTRALKYDESAAYRRIAVARVVRRYPQALPLVASGELTLTSIMILSPVLTTGNCERLFKDARGKTKRELETIAAGQSPLAPRMDSVRAIPAAAPSWGASSAPGVAGMIESQPPRQWQAIMPLSLARVRIGFDAAVDVSRLIDRARQVLRHKYPEGRLEDVIRDALELLLDRKDPQRKIELAPGSVERAEPRFMRTLKAGRYIPARVKRTVWQRDDGRCAWRFPDGTVCGSRDWLEYDHVRPFARGGRSDSPRNVRLLCRLHNGLAAESVFGVGTETRSGASFISAEASGGGSPRGREDGRG